MAEVRGAGFQVVVEPWLLISFGRFPGTGDGAEVAQISLSPRLREATDCRLFAHEIDQRTEG